MVYLRYSYSTKYSEYQPIEIDTFQVMTSHQRMLAKEKYDVAKKTRTSIAEI